jgi:hypothetical protein
MLKKFFMPVLKEEGPNDVQFQQDAVPSHFHVKVTYFLNGMFPEKWFGRGSLSFGHLVQLTLVPFNFFPLVVYQRCCVCAIFGYHFARTCWKECGLKLNTDISAGPHVVTSLK